MQEQNIHKPGIYFGMSEEEYHSDKSMSHSKMKEANISWLNFSDKYMNSNAPQDTTTSYLEFGKAVEAKLLEPERWENEYIQDLILPENALVTIPDLKQWLDEYGADYKKSAAKPVLIDTILALEPKTPIADRLKEDFYADNAGKNIVSADTMHDINNAVRVIKNHAEGHYLEDGVSQVSLFWLEGSVPMKCRLDLLKPGIVTDLKTFSNSRRKSIGKLVKDTTSSDYLMQSFIYMRGLHAVIEGIKAGEYKIYGEYSGGLMDAIAKTKEWTFAFCFIESSRPYNYRAIPIVQTEGYWTNAEAAFMEFIAGYTYGMENYGYDKEWRFEEKADPLLDCDVPFYVFGNVEITGSEEEISV